jgi:lipopolysaccharide transport system permease protein
MKFDYEISSKKGAFSLNLKELWKYRDLITLLVKRDYVAVYKQTVLGPVWFFIQPIFTSIIFTVIFGQIANLAPLGIPPFLFFLSGQTFWNYFASCLTSTASTFTSNANVFGKVYFPRMAVPVSVVLSNILKFSIQFVLLIVVWLYYYFFSNYNLQASSALLLIPVYLIIMATLGLSIGLIISSLTTKYRDFTFLVGFGVQLLMYATPVVYPLSKISDSKFYPLIKYNPITPVIEAAKYSFGCGGEFNSVMLVYSLVVAFCLLLFGIAVFNRVEKTFMDTV